MERQITTTQQILNLLKNKQGLDLRELSEIIGKERGFISGTISSINKNNTKYAEINIGRERVRIKGNKMTWTTRYYLRKKSTNPKIFSNMAEGYAKKTINSHEMFTKFGKIALDQDAGKKMLEEIKKNLVEWHNTVYTAILNKKH